MRTSVSHEIAEEIAKHPRVGKPADNDQHTPDVRPSGFKEGYLTVDPLY